MPRRPRTRLSSCLLFQSRRAGADRRFPGPAAARTDPFSASSILVLWHNNVATNQSKPRVLLVKASISIYSIQNRPHGHSQRLFTQSLGTARIQHHLICSPERHPATISRTRSALAAWRASLSVLLLLQYPAVTSSTDRQDRT